MFSVTLTGSNQTRGTVLRLIFQSWLRARSEKTTCEETSAQRGGLRGGGGVNMLASLMLCESDKVQLFSFSMRTLVS